jgi:hypothetical protein
VIVIETATETINVKRQSSSGRWETMLKTTLVLATLTIGQFGHWGHGNASNAMM